MDWVEKVGKGIEVDGQVRGAWLDAYLDLKASGLHWKKAVFVAWHSAPKATRQPRTMKDLATKLGYASEQVLYKWKKQEWFKASGVDQIRETIFLDHLAEVDQVTINAALYETGRDGVQARKLFYELAGVLNPNRVELANPEGETFEIKAIDYRQRIGALAPDDNDE